MKSPGSTFLYRHVRDSKRSTFHVPGFASCAHFPGLNVERWKFGTFHLVTLLNVAILRTCNVVIVLAVASVRSRVQRSMFKRNA